jgi:hypothetical protein
MGETLAPRLLQKRTRSQGSFPPLALPSLSSITTLSDTRLSRPPTTTLRPLPSPATGLPQLPGSPFRHAVPNTPIDQNGCVCRLLPRPTWAFPVIQLRESHICGMKCPTSDEAIQAREPRSTRTRPSCLTDEGSSAFQFALRAFC